MEVKITNELITEWLKITEKTIERKANTATNPFVKQLYEEELAVLKRYINELRTPKKAP